MQRLSGFVLSCSDYPHIDSSGTEDEERVLLEPWTQRVLADPALINTLGDDTNYCLPAQQPS